MVRHAKWLNTAWMLSCAREARSFGRALRNVRSTQEDLLFRILRKNRSTWYGRKKRFGEIRSVREYQERVPLVEYEQIRGEIDRIASGESNVLTRDPVSLLEPTGGSSHAEKLIPYTAALKKEFQRAIAAWIFHVMRDLPSVRDGRAYWSISPMSERPRTSSAGIPIGFEDDRDYLASWQRLVISQLMVVPAQVRRLRSIENARYVTALHLLASADLSLISVWSPTYLTSILADLPDHWRAICNDLRDGRVRLPHPERTSAQSLFGIQPDAQRSDQLQSILGGSANILDTLPECWPRLSLISCWGDATSSLYLPQVREQFPQAVVQPKGLMATEGVVSIPLLSMPGSILAIRSHFMEFIEVTEPGDGGGATCYLADQLEIGRRYRVILTTGGGLYRYDLADEIEVIDFHHQCPCIRFVGRGHLVSDLVGEKLHEQFVRRALEELVAQFDLNVRFAMVAPLAKPPLGYRLYIELDPSRKPCCTLEIQNRLEQLLRANPHYRIAVESRQLHPIEVQLLSRGGWESYERTCVARGQQLGDIKAVALDAWPGWEQTFAESSS